MTVALLAHSIKKALGRSYDPDRLDNRNEGWINNICKHVAPRLRRYFKARVVGLDRIPGGAAIYVGNHNGGGLMPDVYLFATALYEERGMADVPYGLAHDIVVRWPVLQQFFVPLGAVRACQENAHKICSAGKKLLVYPGGDAEAMRPFRDRNRIVFGKRRGYVKLALREGVPLIPVVAHGAHSTAYIVDDGRWIVKRLGLDRSLRLNAWPITVTFPWGLTLGPPPPYGPFPTKITVEVLEPIAFDRSGTRAAGDVDYVERCHRQVVQEMQRALDRMADGTAIQAHG